MPYAGSLWFATAPLGGHSSASRRRRPVAANAVAFSPWPPPTRSPTRCSSISCCRSAVLMPPELPLSRRRVISTTITAITIARANAPPTAATIEPRQGEDEAAAAAAAAFGSRLPCLRRCIPGGRRARSPSVQRAATIARSDEGARWCGVRWGLCVAVSFLVPLLSRVCAVGWGLAPAGSIHLTTTRCLCRTKSIRLTMRWRRFGEGQVFVGPARSLSLARAIFGLDPHVLDKNVTRVLRNPLLYISALGRFDIFPSQSPTERSSHRNDIIGPSREIICRLSVPSTKPGGDDGWTRTSRARRCLLALEGRLKESAVGVRVCQVRFL